MNESRFAGTDSAHTLGYRPCVGIVLCNARGHVFSGKRLQKNLPAAAPLWQLPQGGIDAGETPLCAARRELHEETGVSHAELIYELPDWLAYDLPPELIGRVLGGQYRGQKQKWFAMRFCGDETEIRLDAHEQAEFSEWCWRPLTEAVELVVPFKRHIYAILAARLAHLIAP